MQTELSRITDDTYVLSLTDDQLLAELKTHWDVFRSSLVNIAKIVGEVHRRGLDLSFMDNPKLIDVLRKIDSGQIVPDLAEKFMHMTVFNRLRNLPVDDQKKIAETGKIDVVVRRGDKFDLRKLPVAALTKDQQRLVFESGRIRSESEMIAILEDQPEPEEDPYNESVVCFKFPSVSIDLKKSESKLLKEKAERCGGMTELLKHAIKKML